MAGNKEKPTPGPEPERLKVEGEWEDAAKRAIEKKRPPGGWPKPKPKGEDEDHEKGQEGQ